MESEDRRGEPPASGEIREGTAGDLEALLAAAAESGHPGRWFGRGAAALGLTGEVDPADARNLFLHGVQPGGTPLDAGPASAPGSGMAAAEVLEQALARRDPRAWRHGTWRDHEWSAADQAALAALDHGLLRRTGGGREALDLPGWDERSIWGWDPRDACYFAQLWRNDEDEDEPDIWINGWETIAGELYRVATTHMLAMEISLATGCPLPEVCTVLGADGPWCD